LAGRPITTGRYSLKHRKSLHDKAQAFLSDPAPYDLTAELVLMRALLQDYLERFSDDMGNMPADEISRVFGLVETITKLVERISKIANETALTQSEVQFLQVRIVDLLIKYVPDPDSREQFIADLADSFGGIRRQPAIDVSATIE
jgi:hypothetical protein